MAYKYNSIPALFSAICDAIRSKTGQSGLIQHQDIPDEIKAIETGGGGEDNLAALLNNSLVHYAPSVDTPNIQSYRFFQATSLISVKFSGVSEIFVGSLGNCTKLTTVDIDHAAGMEACIYAGSMSGCSNLETLILRGSLVAILRSTAAFSGTKIAAGTGYIYVPSALLDSYQSASNWSTYAAQFRAIEDYPDICGGTTT